MGKRKSNVSNKANKAEPKLSRAEREAAEAKKYKRTKIGLIIAAAVAGVAVIVASVIGIISAIWASETVDYMNDDLSKYIYISRDDYVGYRVELDIDPVDDMAIDAAIAKAIYATRVDSDDKNSLKSGVEDDDLYARLPVTDGVQRLLRAGDTVYIRYIGYYTAEDGSRTYFDGGCNFDDADPYELGIGSGSFIPGFETGLIGKNPEDYSKYGVVSNRAIAEGDVVVVSMSAIYADGTVAEDETYTVVVNKDICDKRFGTGFADFLIGKELGEEKTYFKTNDAVDASGFSVYTNISIDKICSVGDNSLTVEARFPKSYDEAALAGKTVNFDVYVEMTDLYTASEIDDSFVTERLGMTVEELRSYGEAGDELIDCYRAYLVESVTEAAKAEVDSELTAAVWKQLTSKYKVKRLPGAEVQSYYDDYVMEITEAYEKGGSAYGTLDAYALTYLDLEADDDWRAHLRKSAEDSVAEKLVFYYIIREEGFLPSDEYVAKTTEELKTELRDYITQQLSPSSYNSEEQYLEAVEVYYNGMLSQYGEDYFLENAVYNYAMEKLKGLADVVYK